MQLFTNMGFKLETVINIYMLHFACMLD